MTVYFYQATIWHNDGSKFVATGNTEKEIRDYVQSRLRQEPNDIRQVNIYAVIDVIVVS